MAAKAAKKNGRRRIRGYSDLTLDDLHSLFSLEIVYRPIFSGEPAVEPNEWLKTALKNGAAFARTSEKARSEFLVAPILVFLSESLDGRIGIYSGVRFDVAPEEGLKGVCDFILSAKPWIPTLQAPVVVVVEAKKNDIEEGLGQCAAEMVAALRFNQQRDYETERVFGCVTTGENWQFLQLDRRNLLTIENQLYFLNELPVLLGRLRFVLEECLKTAPDK